LRSRGFDNVFIGLTADADSEVAALFMREGADIVHSKPVTATELDLHFQRAVLNGLSSVRAS